MIDYEYEYEYGYLNGMSTILCSLGLDVNIKRTQDRGNFNICLDGDIVHSGSSQTCRKYLLDFLVVKKWKGGPKNESSIFKPFENCTK